MKTLVALSGGPKSMVTAWLLKKQGMQVRGVYFDLSGSDVLKSKMQELEKRLGIPVQVVDVSAELGAALEEDCLEYVKQAFPFRPEVSLHRKILFPRLFKMRAETGFDRIATGHQITLQEDLAAGLVRVVNGPDVQLDEIACLVPVPQAELARLLAPIGAIPESMLQKLIGEVAPPGLTGIFEVDWESIRARFESMHHDALQGLLQVYTTQGVLIDSVPRSTLRFGGGFTDPANPETRHLVADIRPWEGKAWVREAGSFPVREIQFDQGHWFSRSDLGMRPAVTGMIWNGRVRPLEIRLIQFDGGRMKGVLGEPLLEDPSTFFRGTSVFFVNGFEVLGAGRITGIK